MDYQPIGFYLFFKEYVLRKNDTVSHTRGKPKRFLVIRNL